MKIEDEDIHGFERFSGNPIVVLHSARANIVLFSYTVYVDVRLHDICK